MGQPPRLRQRRLVLLVWVLLAIFYFYLSYDYIHVSMNDRAFDEYIDHAVQLAADQRRNSNEVRTLILVKAEELGIRIRGDQILIIGAGQTLNVKLDYTADIELPLFERVIYTKQFHHDLSYHPLR